MPMNNTNPFPFKGLSTEDVSSSRLKDGANIVTDNKGAPIWDVLKNIIREPMFLLLIACTLVYFFVGQMAEAWFMSGAIIMVSGISYYQDKRSRNALRALEEFTQPYATVIRADHLLKIPSQEIVVGDYVVVAEGEFVLADGVLKQANDFSVNESILTGEAFSVVKEPDKPDRNEVFSGTLASTGQCIFEVTAIGDNTKLGQIGRSIENIDLTKSPLQLQIGAFVKKMAFVGGFIFLLIWLINFLRSGSILDSLLKGLTIAMSVLPEEIPVAFVTFMALGAYRLMRSGVIVKQTSTVEALGAATVLCTDKTGTITENRMEIYECYDLHTDRTYSGEDLKDPSLTEIISTAMWASESVPFDSMEQAIHTLYAATARSDQRPFFKMIHEYPLEGKPPMMTHIFENERRSRIIACKGAPERLLEQSALSIAQKARLTEINSTFAKQGLRVLAVANAVFEGDNFPENQQDYILNFLGMIGFYDPPKKNISEIFKTLHNAGIQVKMITGDNPETAHAISIQAKMNDREEVITSNELLQLNEEQFDQAVMANNIFARIFPEMKLRIIESLKKQGHVVGMTGDGVNDGPALKAAHIGIAMGKKGSEIAKSAASLILTDDDFGKMIDAVAMGRRIYTNLKKAIQYIISIHIPIILIVAIPSLLGWVYPTIFTPVHVIFLELIMGPTCSIVYENEPIEKHSMLQPPRSARETLFDMKELTVSIVQGIGITAGVLFIYWYGVQKGFDEYLTRTMVFSTLVIANILLTYVNRSFYYSVLTTLKYKNNLLIGITSFTALLLVTLMYVPVTAHFFKIVPLNFTQFAMCIATALISVCGFELYKLLKRRRNLLEISN